ncbi:peroxiredoxin family protein [Alistipes sp. ZOR0009]|uniref:peroxiredoxin family protein n=1 Tax=Alistipes sp. ZOR0009 TaxID=1339253 RepID=UPI00068CFDB2|nr:TlpA disulfide reductase family protein [Alistipes sp. ZOR0009]
MLILLIRTFGAFVLVFGTFFASFAQKGTSTIRGTVANLSVRYVYVEISQEKRTIVDSIEVEGGIFEKKYAADSILQLMVSLDRPLSLLSELSKQGKKVDLSAYYPNLGNESSPTQAVLRPILDEMIPKPLERKLHIFIKPGEDINLKVPMTGISNAEVQGSTDVVKYVAFLQIINPLEQQLELVEREFKTYEGELSIGLIAQFDDRLTALKRQMSTEAFNFVKANPTSPYIYAISWEYISQDIKLLAEVCKILEEKKGLTKEGISLKRNLLRYSKAPEGSVVPDFTATDSKGNSVTLSQLKGTVVLVEFWASWCAPCRAENPYLAYINERYKDKGFVLVSFSLDNKKESWFDAMDKDKMTWINVSDLEGIKSAIASKYGVRGIPANYLICDGKIVAVNLRKQLLNEKLQEILK